MKQSVLLPLLTILSCALVCGTGAPPAAAQLVSIDPPTTEPASDVFDVLILLDPQGESVMGVEVSIRFDTNIVKLLEVLPGDWYTTPPADQYFFWDYTHPGTELIHFAGTSLGQPLDVGGTLAICRFEAVGAGICPLDFLGLDVRDGDNNRLNAEHSSGDRIIIDAAVATDSCPLESVKALYR